MSDKGGRRHKVVKDCTGATLKLVLKLKEEYKNKNYNLYAICKVKENEDGEEEYIELYNETFTEKQHDEFYTKPTYYVAGIPE